MDGGREEEEEEAPPSPKGGREEATPICLGFRGEMLHFPANTRSRVGTKNLKKKSVLAVAILPRKKEKLLSLARVQVRIRGRKDTLDESGALLQSGLSFLVQRMGESGQTPS